MASAVIRDGFAKSNAEHITTEAARDLLGILQESRVVVVIFGRGGNGVPLRRLVEAAASTPEYHWYTLGEATELNQWELPANLTHVGWSDSVAAWMRAADVIVTAAGHNSVMEAGRSGTPFIAIAEPRPFDEQIRKVAVLQRERLAVGLSSWPSDGWQPLLRHATDLDIAPWKQIYRGDGAKQAADVIRRFANASHEIKMASPFQM